MIGDKGMLGHSTTLVGGLDQKLSGCLKLVYPGESDSRDFVWTFRGIKTREPGAEFCRFTLSPL